MMHKKTAFALAGLSMLACGPMENLYAQQMPEFKLKLQPIEELPSGEKPQVINGSPADAKNWPSTFVFRNSNGAGCTATAVGPRVIIVAAHCIEDNTSGTAEIENLITNVQCKHHPNYPVDKSADFSLCLTSETLPTPSGGFETINTNDSTIPKDNQRVTLLGYGCRTTGGGDASFGSLYEGDAKIYERATGSLYTITRGGSAVCFGDSGGGAYVAINTTGTIRRLWGVNSQGDIARYSWISTTANPTFIDWAKAWSGANGSAICGLNTSAQNCRQ